MDIGLSIFPPGGTLFDEYEGFNPSKEPYLLNYASWAHGHSCLHYKLNMPKNTELDTRGPAGGERAAQAPMERRTANV